MSHKILPLVLFFISASVYYWHHKYFVPLKDMIWINFITLKEKKSKKKRPKPLSLINEISIYNPKEFLPEAVPDVFSSVMVETFGIIDHCQGKPALLS